MKDLVKILMSVTAIAAFTCFLSGCGRFHTGSGADYENFTCHNKKLMDFYLSKEFDKNLIDKKFKASKNDQQIINNRYATYYRFLSIVSGLESPFNYEPKYILNGSYELSHDYRNIKLINWYENNIDSISCELFNEYYQIETGFINITRITELEDIEKQIESYGDSIFGRLRDFKIKHSPLICIGDTSILREGHFSKDTIRLKEIELVDNKILINVLDSVMISDRRNPDNRSLYSADIRSFNNWQLVRIVDYGEVKQALLYSENGYDGYILVRDIPVVISLDKTIKYSCLNQGKNRTFEILSKEYPFSECLNSKHWFIMSDTDFTKIDAQTGIDTWNDIILQSE